ncbi:LysR substrate-binding domain-containing protein [Roseibium sp. RKSG952]|uniref:LysR substrate-binding domain-containing protein n=1 Tax=Roseibium sp. RKSG952 TaxID=2529384 RepID=UPI0012BCC3FC|nr:LysR substrate-binding domain-containing protein [Roseibium sp. RKSG952]MTI03842.1 LysR family transcriptional regulator [Roseibium sp. RKSG952]
MDRLPNPSWLRSFEAAARHLNFTATAQELGLTQTAVSLHIRSLEAELGQPLFTRQARRLELTELGQSYALTVRRALSDITLSTNSLFGPASQQTLTIRAAISTMTYWLAAELPEFASQHPDIPVRLVTHIWNDTMGSSDVDIDIRLGYGDWPGLRAEKLSDEFLVPVCRSGTTAPSKAEFRESPLIHILGYEDNWARYFEAHGIHQPELQSQYSADTTVTALQLVMAGAGYATILERFARNAIAQGAPLQIAGPPIPFAQSHYLIRSDGATRPTASARLFETWLQERIKADAAD